jgi:putative SOS response-associated peptidase YedK
MCGRYYSLFDKQQVAEHFHVRRTADNFGPIAPNYNIAPDTFQPVIRRSRETGERELVMMRWGIVPWFAKSEVEFKALSTSNAKSDRLTDSKMWREPFAKRRCLVPASGLYEWPKHNKIKEEFLVSEVPEASAESGDLFPIELGPAPVAAVHRSGKPLNRVVRAKPIKRVFAISLTEPGPFAFAGIWDSWKRPDGTRLKTFALVTTEPNELVAQIHDRLALILHPRDYDRWLGIPESGDPRPPLDLLHPYDAARMKMTPANPAVGNWRNNGPEMLDPP